MREAHDRLELLVIGCGPADPVAGKGGSCYVVRKGSDVVVLDLGFSSLDRLSLQGLDAAVVDNIFLTHLHPDHYSEMVAFLHAARWTRKKPLHLYGCVGTKRLVAELMALPGMDGFDDPAVRVEELSAGRKVIVGGLSVKAFAASHAQGSLGFSVSDGTHRICYTGDTSLAPLLVEECKGSDILVCECGAHGDKQIPIHLTAREVGVLASESRARLLVITHLSSKVAEEEALAEVRELYKGKAVFARPFQKIVVTG